MEQISSSFYEPTEIILIAIIIIRVDIFRIVISVINIILIIRILIVLTQVGSPESEEDGEHFSSRPIDFTTGRRMSDDSSEGEEEYFR